MTPVREIRSGHVGVVLHHPLVGVLRHVHPVGANIAAVGMEEADAESQVRFHDLRQTDASLLVAQKAHPKARPSPNTRPLLDRLVLTMDRYSHLFRETYAEEAAKLDAKIFGASRGSLLGTVR